MKRSDKINLVYIASIGHSGSTLLESILGSHSKIATCGEIHIWPHEIVNKGVLPCSCGKSVIECGFWGKMLQAVDPLQQLKPQIDYFREKHNAGHTVRIKRLPDFTNRKLTAEIEGEMQIYAQNNYDVFKSFLELIQIELCTQVDWIVDASKDPYRLAWLARSNLFNLKVIQVVRNPPAFVYSMLRKLPKDKGNLAYRRFYETARQSLKWSIENELIRRVAENHLKAEDYMLINYESLALQPSETFKKICDTIGCQFEQQAVNDFRAGNIHTIAGNPMRYREGGIVLDEKWKRSLPTHHRVAAETLTLFNKHRYGYH
jgi:hypothetical protein